MDGDMTDDEQKDFVARAVAMIDEGLYSDALAHAEARLREHRDDPQALLVAAVTRVRMGDLEAAKELQRAADALLELNARLYDHLGDAYRDGERPDTALACYRKALSLAPEADEVAVRTQKIVDLAGDGENGITDKGRVSSDLFTVTLAELYEKQGYRQQAEEVYREILNRDPENQEVKRRLKALSTGGDELVDELEQWLYRLHQRHGYE